MWNRCDLNGQICTVTPVVDESAERVGVVAVCNGIKRNLLVKRENLQVSFSSMKRSLLKNKDGINKHLVQNTTNDCKEFEIIYQKLIERLEEAISCRNSKRLALAEKYFTELLVEVEIVCVKNSPCVARFVKSFGVLRVKQERFGEAECLFARADKLRPADYDDNPQGTQTLELFFVTQLDRRRFDTAADTLSRLRNLKHCIRPGVDSNIRKLEEEMVAAKAQLQRCVACGSQTKVFACARCRETVYCSRSCQKGHWKIHKRICKAYIVLDSKDNLPTQTSLGSITHKHEIRQPESNLDSLTTSVLLNAKATDIVSPSSPTKLCDPIIAALNDPLESYFFCMNEVTSSSLLERDGGRRRFLATTGVFTCITVFAWSPTKVAGGLGRCVGGHVSIGALLRGLRACQITKQDIECALNPLMLQLRHCFEGVNQNITVTLIGSHRAMDTCKALKGWFPDDREKWSFTWHVKSACEAALDSVLNKVIWNTKLLMRFEGELITDCYTEERVRMKHMNFLVAALDTITGFLVTHTQYTQIETLLTTSVILRQREVYKCDPALGVTFLDNKLQVVSHLDEE